MLSNASLQSNLDLKPVSGRAKLVCLFLCKNLTLIIQGVWTFNVNTWKYVHGTLLQFNREGGQYSNFGQNGHIMGQINSKSSKKLIFDTFREI